MVLSAFKIGSRVRVNLGNQAGQEGVVVSRKLNPSLDPAVQYGPGVPQPQTRSWTYQVKLDSGETRTFSSMELHGTKGSEWESPPGDP